MHELKVSSATVKCEEASINRYQTFDELYLYCYRVAGTVGLLTSPIFGYSDDAALQRHRRGRHVRGPVPPQHVREARRVARVVRDHDREVVRGVARQAAHGETLPLPARERDRRGTDDVRRAPIAARDRRGRCADLIRRRRAHGAIVAGRGPHQLQRVGPSGLRVREHRREEQEHEAHDDDRPLGHRIGPRGSELGRAACDPMRPRSFARISCERARNGRRLRRTKHAARDVRIRRRRAPAGRGRSRGGRRC